MRDSLSMMQHPERWPQWPFLPMKRYTKTPEGGTDIQCGIIHVDDPLTLRLHNLFELTPPPIETLVYSSQQAILNAGWEVD